MSWAKVDDMLAMHPKVMRAGNEALGLWVRSLSWSVAHLTDGAVPHDLVAMLGARQETADRLVSAGLWHETFDGYEFHDWAEYQFTRERVVNQRETNRARLANWRDQKGASSNTVSNAVTNDVRIMSHTHTHTHRESNDASVDDGIKSDDLSVKKKVSAVKSRGSRVSDDFAVDDSLRKYAAEKAAALDVDREREKFINYFASASGANAVKLDWRKTFQNWLLSGQERAEQRGWVATKITDHSVKRSRLDAFLEGHSITRDEYERRKGETGWLESFGDNS